MKPSAKRIKEIVKTAWFNIPVNYTKGNPDVDTNDLKIETAINQALDEQIEADKKIFIAICKDRHIDTTAHPFSTAEKAIKFARKRAKEYAREPDDVEESDIDGWLFYATFSCEGDCIYVIETEMDKSEYVY